MCTGTLAMHFPECIHFCLDWNGNRFKSQFFLCVYFWFRWVSEQETWVSSCMEKMFVIFPQKKMESSWKYLHVKQQKTRECVENQYQKSAMECKLNLCSELKIPIDVTASLQCNFGFFVFFILNLLVCVHSSLLWTHAAMSLLQPLFTVFAEIESIRECLTSGALFQHPHCLFAVTGLCFRFKQLSGAILKNMKHYFEARFCCSTA